MQKENQHYKSKYGAYPLREYDLSDTSRRLTPSYWSYPSDYSFDIDTFTGETNLDASRLNYECFCIAKDWLEKGDKMLKSLEEYDGVKARRNVYEEVLCRVRISQLFDRVRCLKI